MYEKKVKKYPKKKI